MFQDTVKLLSRRKLQVPRSLKPEKPFWTLTLNNSSHETSNSKFFKSLGPLCAQLHHSPKASLQSLAFLWVFYCAVGAIWPWLTINNLCSCILDMAFLVG